MANRIGEPMLTFSGRLFWPLDPRPEEIFLIDIAHALSNTCRYSGHTSQFYSVAEHSVILSNKVPWEHRLWALLHDASEAYLNDIVRPVKANIAGYAIAEQKIMTAVCEKFGLPPGMPAAVRIADTKIIRDEMQQLCQPCPPPGKVPEEGLGISVRAWEPKQAKRAFLDRFTELV